MPSLILLAGVLGLLVGSFLNVVVWRVPRGESVVSPPSSCPRCGHRIRPWDNVPVLGWLWLRGRCRDCGEPIAARYPLIEAGTGALFALTCWWVLTRGTPWLLPAAAYLAAIAVALTLIDLDVRRLPDTIVLPSYPVLLALLALASWGGDDWGALFRAVLAGLALALFYFLVVIAYPAGMGLGDVKLAGVLGMAMGWIGWGAVLIGWFATFLVAGLFALGLVATRRAGRGTAIPFGPWMFVGAAIGIVAGPRVWELYLLAFS